MKLSGLHISTTLAGGVTAALLAFACSSWSAHCEAQTQAQTLPAKPEHEASNDSRGLTVRAQNSVRVKGTDLVVIFEQQAEGDAKLMDAALADASSRLSKIADEAKLPSGSLFLREIQAGGGSRDGGSYSGKSGGPTRVSWCIRVTDRATIESVLVASAALPKEIRFRAVAPTYSSVDAATRESALAGAAEIARKQAAAMAAAAGCKLGPLVAMHEVDSTWNSSVSQFEASSTVVQGPRVWMPEIVTPKWVARVEATFDILPQ